jgi:putative transposase
MNGESPIAPGAHYLVYSDRYEVITVELQRITLRSVAQKKYLVVSPDEFRVQVLAGHFKPYQEAPINRSLVPILSDLSSKQSRAARRKIFYVEGLTTAFHGSLPHTATVAEIQRLGAIYPDPHPPCYTVVYEWIRNYKRSNQNPWALIQKPSAAPRGRLLGEDTHRIINEYIDEWYLKLEHPNIRCLHKFIVAAIERNNELRTIYTTERIKAPSLSTVRRAVDKVAPYLRDLYHYGQKEADRRHRYGAKRYALKTLLSLVEGDSHLVDIELVDRDGHNLGRPWLYVLLDILTRCVIGWELSFTPPCAEKLVRALRMALSVSPAGHPGGKFEELDHDLGTEADNERIKNIAYLVGFKLAFGPPACPNVP